MGMSMLITKENWKQTVFITLLMLTFNACKQSEFYDKSALLEPAKSSENNPGTDVGSNPGSVTTVTDPTGGNSGGLIPTTPVVVTPPVVDITPPEVIAPPVVLSPPVIITPPAVVVTPRSDCVGSWGTCTKTCGGGLQTFLISSQARGGGNSCAANNGSTQACNIQACVNLADKSEIFIQDSTRDGDVDILWVIDDSGSMADNQEALAKNFNNFINLFLDKKIDFKMAITTTDGTSSRNGKMVGDSSKLTKVAADANKQVFISNFSKWIKVGTSGSGIEQGLKCASSFLDRYSTSFLREDAYLAIVFLSDEEDQSDKKVSEYLARFQAAKKSKGMVKAYSIVTTKMPKAAQWETIGNRYMEVTKATSGVSSEITNDFSGTLKDMGGSIVNLIDRFALAEVPVDNVINVFVNNTQVDTGWTYDSIAHTLKFNADSLPTEGSKIEVRYKVKVNVLGAI